MHYPDAKTPWRSQAEYLDAMAATNSRGERRYEVDEAYRQAVAAKLGLGFENAEGPSIHGTNASYDSVLGRKESSLKIQFGEQDQFEAQERVRLQGEIDHLKEAETQVAPAADADQREKALVASIEAVARGAAPTPFSDGKELVAAMSHERYRRDPQFRAGVEARAGLGVPGVTATVSDDGSQSEQA